MRTDLDGIIAEVIEVIVEVSAVAKPEITARVLRRLILLAAETGSRMNEATELSKRAEESRRLPRGLRGLELRREGRVARADARRAVRVAAEERNVRL